MTKSEYALAALLQISKENLNNLRVLVTSNLHDANAELLHEFDVIFKITKDDQENIPDHIKARLIFIN